MRLFQRLAIDKNQLLEIRIRDRVKYNLRINLPFVARTQANYLIIETML
jgi:hypothetical protein